MSRERPVLPKEVIDLLGRLEWADNLHEDARCPDCGAWAKGIVERVVRHQREDGSTYRETIVADGRHRHDCDLAFFLNRPVKSADEGDGE